MVLRGPPVDARYSFFTIVRPWFKPPNLWPYFAVVLLVIALMAAILALNLARPLTRLKSVMRRFGSGDLSARSDTKRNDEIGQLATAFNEMADRIETLLSAERRLLQDVSHELRSPLARLGFALELARSGPNRELALQRIETDIGRLGVLVKELLDLTRLEGAPRDHALEVVCLDALLRATIDVCQVEADARSCVLRLDSQGDARIEGHADLLQRAIENVVRNAIRYSPEGGAVDIALRATDKAMEISVRDHGTGVPEALLASIFEPFFRVEDDRSRASGGVGLGLSIACRAVAVHGGSVRAENANPGLVVTLTLPRETAERGSELTSPAVASMTPDRPAGRPLPGR